MRFPADRRLSRRPTAPTDKTASTNSKFDPMGFIWQSSRFCLLFAPDEVIQHFDDISDDEEVYLREWMDAFNAVAELNKATVGWV